MREAWDNQGNDLNEGGMGQSGQRLNKGGMGQSGQRLK